jgi:anti-sigma factor RsiW
MAERCPDVEPLLSALLDGELDEATAVGVRSHLEGCARCLAEAEQLSSVRRLVRNFPVRRLPDDVTLTPAVPVAAPRPRSLLARTGATLAVTAGLLGGAAFALGSEPAADVPTVAVPMDVYAADHFVHTANRALSIPVALETGR